MPNNVTPIAVIEIPEGAKVLVKAGGKEFVLVVDGGEVFLEDIKGGFPSWRYDVSGWVTNDPT